ncbi:hypothetical protein SPRG_01365 [Saprolegnia parasitica CBS 223.65]|uniref:Uncharacterized protein n=1 Tax=Saprolegnia parasitica (strain CBS 223.65) TaxID=695850 RepID=A0A067D5W7_SAPPC|nr:hypothetical protein SPRG_01365 [Saprolegnia parasitica CBS 223.65]KDO34091.1 hypothetical protein SPRG_01365 [Saprolegnia parasitica CBS 223.65]|eukprot:XP_012194975.1 hypothetical protein SPRG_01365 [Saprolegnia parasitica CBS 223.65]
MTATSQRHKVLGTSLLLILLLSAGDLYVGHRTTSASAAGWGIPPLVATTTLAAMYSTHRPRQHLAIVIGGLCLVQLGLVAIALLATMLGLGATLCCCGSRLCPDDGMLALEGCATASDNCATSPFRQACAVYALVRSLYVTVWVAAMQYEAAKEHVALQDGYANYVALYQRSDPALFAARADVVLRVSC